MGQKDSKEERSAVSPSSVQSNTTSRVENVFNRLVENEEGILTEQKLKTIFGDSLGELVFNYFSKNKSVAIDKENFVARAVPFLGTSFDPYYSFILNNNDHVTPEDFQKALNVCTQTSGASLVKSDKDRAFLQLLADNMFSTSSQSQQCSIEDFKSWINSTCPRLLESVQKTISYGLQNGKMQESEKPVVLSEILSPFQVWFVQCCIPVPYLNANVTSGSKLDSSAVAQTPFRWTLLYSSREHGLSPNRFETKVFNYRSPTVLFLCLQNKEVFAIGVDCEWRQGTQPFGGISCFVYQLFPKFEIIDQGPSLIYFNTKSRAVMTGLMVYRNQKSPYLTVDPDFNNLADIEVWGCGPPDASSAQDEHKKWEKRQAEKHAKVPLPGNWDENPDKAILEIAGVKVNHGEAR